MKRLLLAIACIMVFEGCEEKKVQEQPKTYYEVYSVIDTIGDHLEYLVDQSSDSSYYWLTQEDLGNYEYAHYKFHVWDDSNTKLLNQWDSTLKVKHIKIDSLLNQINH